MSDLLCQWINNELRLSQRVEPLSLARDFSNGYLLGEILHKHQLLEDFHQFSKHSTASAKLNNFTRLEPPLHLLGVPFEPGMAKAVMQGQQGAATHLLYQLYILLQKKTRLGLTSAMLETMQPAAIARLHHVEKQIYTKRLRTVVKRETDVKMQKIAQRFDKRGRDAYSRSVNAELEREERRRHLQEQRRLQDIQKHRQARRKQQEIMDRIQTAGQIPQPPKNGSARVTGKSKPHLQQTDNQNIYYQISEFEKNKNKPSPASRPASVSVPVNREHMQEWNNAFVRKIRKRLEEDAMAREQRERRRCRALIQQLQTQETQNERQREEQLIGRLTRQSQQEKRIAVQLIQIREQKKVLRKNRFLRENEIQQHTLQQFIHTLNREAALLQQDLINRKAELDKEREFHRHLAVEHAQSKHRKHIHACTVILDHIVDLATRVGEYRLLTANLIPVKMIREWKALWLNELPLYETRSSLEQEMEKLHILNEQDYTDYMRMTGEWAWSTESHSKGQSKSPPLNNDFLVHVASRLRILALSELTSSSEPPSFTLRVCVLGKACSGKTTCLTRISQVHGLHIVSVDALIQEALEAHRTAKPENEVNTRSSDSPEQEMEQIEGAEPLSSSPTEPGTQSLYQCTTSLQAQHGAAVEQALKAGKSVPDELLVKIITDAIRKIPSGQGWVLDGFPLELSQAQLLKKALGGIDPDQDYTNELDKIYELVVDSNAAQAFPRASTVLNLAVLLEVSDEQVLLRHHRSVQKKINSDYTAPPAEGRSQQQQIQHRLLDFQESWPKMERWFEAEQILVRVDADVDEDTLYKTVETVLLDSINAAGNEAEAEAEVEAQLHPETDTTSDSQKSESDLRAGSSRRTSVSSVSAAESLSSESGSSVTFMDHQLPRVVAKRLLLYWKKMRSWYMCSVKAVMENLRHERNLIIHHFYNIRDEYKQYLMRPDLKQEFVTLWQRDYNSVAEDMRQEEETKSELHQRLEDLRMHLLDICNKRREETIQEKAALTEDGWLQHHNSLIINHYCTLIQVEMDRFHNTVRLLRGYYSGMYKGALPEAPPEFTCITLLDINRKRSHSEKFKSSVCSQSEIRNDGKNDTEDKKKGSTPSETKNVGKKDTEDKKKVSAGSESKNVGKKDTENKKKVSAGSESKNVGKKEKDAEDKKKVPADSTQSEAKNAGKKDTDAEDKKRVPSSADPSRHKMYSYHDEKLVHDVHRAAVTAVTKLMRMDIQQLEQDSEESRQEARILALAFETHPTKEKKKNDKSKGSPHPIQEKDIVESKKKRKGMKVEYRSALKHEDHAVCDRLERVKSQCLKTLRSLQHEAEAAQRELDEWGRDCHMAEIKSVDQLADIIRHHIECGTQITYELILESDNICIDGDMRLVLSPSPPPHPLPIEVIKKGYYSLSVQKLYSLHSHLFNSAPTGLVSCGLICEILLLCVGSDALSETWIRLSNSQDCGVVDWRQFLLCAAYPWPLPSQKQLLNTLTQFRKIDTTGNGVITLQQYLQVELWFPTQRQLLIPDDSMDPQSYDRLTSLRKFFFILFSDSTHCPPVCDYMNMLMYLSSHPDPAQGFTRALSLVTNQTLCYTQTHTTGLLQSYVTGDVCADDEEDVFGGDEGDVSMEDILRVVNHRRVSSQHIDAQVLVEVFQSLGFKPDEKIPFSLISKQTDFYEMMSSSQYLLADFSTVVEMPLGSSAENAASEITSNTSRAE